MPSEVPVSNETKKLLKRILTKDPQKRIEWMELFQLKISNDGKLLDPIQGRVSLVDDEKNAVREISETSTEDLPNSGTFPQGAYMKKQDNSINSTSNYNSFSSPRSNPNIPSNDLAMSVRQPKSDDKSKVPFMKKNHTVEEV